MMNTVFQLLMELSSLVTIATVLVASHPAIEEIAVAMPMIVPQKFGEISKQLGKCPALMNPIKEIDVVMKNMATVTERPHQINIRVKIAGTKHVKLANSFLVASVESLSDFRILSAQNPAKMAAQY